MRRPRVTSALAWLLAGLCLAAFGLAAVVVHGAAQTAAVRDFNLRATQIESSLAVTLRRADDAAVALAATLSDQKRALTDDELTRWYAGVTAEQRFSSLLGVSLIRYVPAAGLSQFMKALGADPPPGEGHGPVRIFPPGRRASYCLVQASVAPQLNRPGVGSGLPHGVATDICAIGGGAILDAARDSGALSAVVITLGSAGRVLNLSVPVYSEEPVPTTVAERRARIVGWALAQFSLRDLLAGALDESSHIALSIYRRGETASTPRTTAFGPVSDVASVGHASQGMLHQTFDVNADGLWIVKVSGPPERTGVAPSVLGIGVFAVGTVISILMWLVLTLFARTRAKSEERLRAIFKHSPAAIFISDRRRRYVASNEAFDNLMGVAPGSAVGQTEDHILPPEMAAAARASHDRVLGGDTVREEWTADRQGEPLALSALKFPLVDANGRAYAVCGIVNDVTERKQLEDRLEHLADYDPLTAVHNRRWLIEALDRQLRYAAQYRRGGVVVTFDFDRLKVVNDTCGPAIGDLMLKALAEELQARTGEADIVARLAGDEFTAVLPEGSEEDALVLARDTRSALCERSIGPPITVSVGIAAFTGEEELTADELLVCADIAVGEAKEAGGDTVKIYSAQSGGVLTWAQRIRFALTNDRFVLYGQPIVNLRDGLITHHELLIRMLSDDGDIIPPAAFLPTAERFGLIGEIDRWVVQEGLKLAKEEGGMAINLSAKSIGDQAIVTAVREAVADGLDPTTIIFEVTETAAATNLGAARLFAGMLNGIGCSVALDDFGTGFGSLMYLKNIPSQYIKIDVEFVRRVTLDETDQMIVRSIVGMASALKKLTVAEGVEDEQTLAAVRDLGVDFAQGYLLGRPKRLSPPTAFERRLNASGELHHGLPALPAGRAPERVGPGLTV